MAFSPPPHPNTRPRQGAAPLDPERDRVFLADWLAHVQAGRIGGSLCSPTASHLEANPCSPTASLLEAGPGSPTASHTEAGPCPPAASTSNSASQLPQEGNPDGPAAAPHQPAAPTSGEIRETILANERLMFGRQRTIVG